MRYDYLALALLWIAYCAVHSALISPRAARFCERLLGIHACYFRLLYNAFAFTTLIPLLLYSRSPRFQGPSLWTWNGNWRFLQYALVLLAASLLFAGARRYSLSQFLGLQQIRDRKNSGALAQGGDIDTTGILGIVRHPWYVAVFILLWTSDQNAVSLLINAILSAYLVVGTRLEERKLITQFGDKYRLYQEKVSMFVPIKWLRSAIQQHFGIPRK